MLENWSPQALYWYRGLLSSVRFITRKLGPVYIEIESCSGKKGYPPTQATLAEPTFPTFRYQTWQTIYMRNKNLPRLEGWPALPGHPLSMIGPPSLPGQLFFHINTSACPAGSTRSKRDDQRMRGQLLARAKGSNFSHVNARWSWLGSEGNPVARDNFSSQTRGLSILNKFQQRRRHHVI